MNITQVVKLLDNIDQFQQSIEDEHGFYTKYSSPVKQKSRGVYKKKVLRSSLDIEKYSQVNLHSNGNRHRHLLVFIYFDFL